MEHTFESFISSFIDNKVGIADDFLPVSLTSGLKENLIELYTSKQLHSAGTGNTEVSHDKKFRSDIIHWLDRENGNPAESAFFDHMDRFVDYLNATCYTGITGYEFHYTLYPTGSFYKRHLDQFRNDDNRKYSMIMYLNENWELVDGGELCIYHANREQRISPNNGKTVFFKSCELEHEVLVTNKPRMSVTGWLKTG